MSQSDEENTRFFQKILSIILAIQNTLLTFQLLIRFVQLCKIKVCLYFNLII